MLGREGQHASFHTGLIGSTVNGVIRKTTKPALVVPTGAQLSGPIVLAFDSSPGSRIGANLAVQLVKNTLAVQGADLEQAYLLVQEPVAGVDDHAQA